MALQDYSANSAPMQIGYLAEGFVQLPYFNMHAEKNMFENGHGERNISSRCWFWVKISTKKMFRVGNKQVCLRSIQKWRYRIPIFILRRSMHRKISHVQELWEPNHKRNCYINNKLHRGWQNMFWLRLQNFTFLFSNEQTGLNHNKQRTNN